MRHFFSAPNKGRAFTLLETLVATFIMAIVAALGFTIMIQGTQYLRVNQLAIDAQKSGLSLLTQLHSELQSTDQSLLISSADGVIFPSPFKDDGTTEYDPINQKVMWQNWICYQYDLAAQKISRHVLPISPASSAPGACAQTPANFPRSSASHMIADHVGIFSVTQQSVTPPIWKMQITAGNMTDTSGYGVQLESQVTLRN